MVRRLDENLQLRALKTEVIAVSQELRLYTKERTFETVTKELSQSLETHDAAIKAVEYNIKNTGSSTVEIVK